MFNNSSSYHKGHGREKVQMVFQNPTMISLIISCERKIVESSLAEPLVD